MNAYPSSMNGSSHTAARCFTRSRWVSRIVIVSSSSEIERAACDFVSFTIVPPAIDATDRWIDNGLAPTSMSGNEDGKRPLGQLSARCYVEPER